MPFYIKGKTGRWEKVNREIGIIRNADKKRVVRFIPVKNDPESLKVETLEDASIVVWHGKNFREAFMDSQVITRSDILVHDRSTNDKVVVIFSQNGEKEK